MITLTKGDKIEKSNINKIFEETKIKMKKY